MAPSFDFQQLLEQSRQLTNHLNASELPSIDRNLDQIEAQTRKLAAKAARAGDVSRAVAAAVDGGPMSMSARPAVLDTRTMSLLANKGFDVERIQSVLQQINLTTAFAPLKAVHDTDLEGYLRNEHESVVSMTIEDTKTRMTEHLDASLARASLRQWEAEKRRIYEELGAVVTSGASGRGLDGVMAGEALGGETTSVFRRPDRGNGSAGTLGSAASPDTPAPSLKQFPVMDAYASVVRQLNESRRRGEPMLLHRAFADVYRQPLNPTQDHLRQCWDAFAAVSGAPTSTAAAPPLAGPSSANIVTGGIHCLEAEFYQYIQTELVRSGAETGGIPTPESNVLCWLRHKYWHAHSQTWDAQLAVSDDDVPLWAVVYLLIRTGHRDRAVKYLEKHRGLAERMGYGDLLAPLQQWAHPGTRDADAGRKAMMQRWTAVAHFTTAPCVPSQDRVRDVFLAMLIKLVGRLILRGSPVSNLAVMATQEDFLWLRLNLIDGHDFTLADFSRDLCRSANHFQGLIWFKALVFAGEFEKAISFLAKQPTFAVDAVHFAIAAAYYKMIVPMDDEMGESRSTTITTSVHPAAVPFDMLWRQMAAYTRDLMAIDAHAVCHYLLTLSLVLPPTTIPVAYNAAVEKLWSLISECLLESGDFAALLGDPAASGSTTAATKGTPRTPGLLETYRTLLHCPTDAMFRDKIIRPTAQRANQQGAFQTAVQLYNMVGDAGRVVRLINRRLGEALAQDLDRTLTSESGAHGSAAAIRSPESRDAVVTTAEDVIHYYRHHVRSELWRDLSAAEKATCELLLTLHAFRRLAAQGQEVKAIEVLATTHLFPDVPDMAAVQGKAEEAARSLDPMIRQLLPEIMVSYMQTLSAAGTKARHGLSHEARHARLQELRRKSRSLLLFAGSLPFRLPGEVFGKLNQLDVLLGC
ncbi:hypothetical protein CXG81DRAFT_16876 [Caulochytrium protostelioides]|uniref:Nuclear pore protein n=1 Tax=Caulochytrium protostelioides TaxID=1555241 RepID=A0A4P9XDR9_9FUNG|nr:hypothetical protein CXG81DRAFT_16876 [Caulochytrium protostelioides]|eukprot:RKP03645.1 hypothetical protein CXG81DRAFT_16876 [Caulochytrium protostelioides]